MFYKSSWQIQEAKSKFSELIEVAMSKGPQKITKRGEEIAVILSKKDYEKLQNSNRGFLEEILNAPRIDLTIREESNEDYP